MLNRCIQPGDYTIVLRGDKPPLMHEFDSKVITVNERKHANVTSEIADYSLWLCGVFEIRFAVP